MAPSPTALTYLDYNATAPLRPAVADAMAAALTEVGNPSSVHAAGRRARQRVEAARRQVGDLVEADPGSVVFTGSGTEANNLALCGTGRRRILTSAIEHDSVLAAAPDAARLAVTAEGVVDLAMLDAALAESDGPTLVSIMLANNETGIVQPIEDAVALCRRAGAMIHVDAVQAAGKMTVSFDALGADLMTLSAHKLGGPQGVGALIVRDGVRIEPQMRGGGQELGRRAGTENVAAIVGFGVAADAACDGVSDQPRIAGLRDALEADARRVAPETVVIGEGQRRLSNTSCLVLPGVPSEVQVMSLDLAGVAVSAGSACSSGKVAPSHVLRAMGLDEGLAASAIRVSLGWNSGEGDVRRFVEAWRAVSEQASRRGPAAA